MEEKYRVIKKSASGITRNHALRLFHAVLATSLPLLLVTATATPADEELLRAETSAIISAAGIALDDPFAQALLFSTDWQHEMLDSGPVEAPERVIAALRELWKEDSDIIDQPVHRGLAVACALETPCRDLPADGMTARYRFFRERYERGELNACYEKLSVFERRFLARGVQHSGFNTSASMEYLIEEVALPTQRYTGACWYADYRSKNFFGDTIHGPMFYTPFQSAWSSHAEMVRKVGGVCGSLSNFGAAAAIANGVPAVTMGEPGHCAYAVMIRPSVWQPAYSLSWRRGMHTAFHGRTWGWHQLIVAAQSDTGTARRSGNLRRLARHHMANGRPDDALAALALARTGHPSDWENWSESLRILDESKAPLVAWRDVHRDILDHLAPVSGEVAFHLLKDAVYARVLSGSDEAIDQRRRLLLAFHEASRDWGLGQWHFADALEEQLKLLGGDEAAGDSFLADVFSLVAEKKVLTGVVLSTQMSRTGEDNVRLQKFLARITRSLSDGKTPGSGALIDILAERILPEAAARGDAATFQFIGKLTAANYPPEPITPEPFPGILLSSGGTFGIEKPGNRYDTPARHWGVIEEHGGYFHTHTTPATATIRLGNFGRLTGVVIVTRPDHIHRLNDAILQISTDGQAWTDIHTFSNVNRIQRIDLGERSPNAGYVRVIQPNGPSIHFHKFLVYGHKQN